MSANTSGAHSASDNFVTVARALHGKLLNKTIFSKYDIVDYDKAKFFRFTNLEVMSLQDICHLVKTLVQRKDCALIRGVAKDDTKPIQRRLFKGAEATVLDRAQNWFALDIDTFGVATGGLRADAQHVLEALGLLDTECFVMPTSSYMFKSGKRIRLFFWNDIPILSSSLKKYFTKWNDVVDLNLLHPVQLIYTARPSFKNDMVDPCKKLIEWIPGFNQCTSIADVDAGSFWAEEKIYTVAEAKRIKNDVFKQFPDIKSGARHDWLFDKARQLFKCVAYDALDDDELYEEFLLNCQFYWKGNEAKDIETIVDGRKAGFIAILGENYDARI
jgi:hypothetical protein